MEVNVGIKGEWAVELGLSLAVGWNNEKRQTFEWD
jgi:hypothetical protein